MIDVCAVCHKNVSKYKCITCFIPFCSVDCGNLHKSSISCRRADQSDSSLNSERKSFCITEDTVPEDKLHLLRDSKELKAILRSEELRDIMLKLDSSPEPAIAVRLAMQNPLFVNFVDQILKMTEPELSEIK